MVCFQIPDPTWGPRKLLHYLTRRQPDEAWPAAALYFGPLLLGRFHERDRVIISAHNRNRLKRPRLGLLPTSPV